MTSVGNMQDDKDKYHSIVCRLCGGEVFRLGEYYLLRAECIKCGMFISWNIEER